MNVKQLERDVYTVPVAARILAMPPTTLKYWLEGRREPDGREYEPVLRESPTGSRYLTWGEFVEAGLLRQYRLRRIPMPELRDFITKLRDVLGVRYPLAHERPFTSGRDLLWQAQRDVGLPESDGLVVLERPGGQYLLLRPADAHLERVEFEHGVAARWRPVLDLRDVFADPATRFGDPTVGGVRTSTIRETYEETHSREETAELYGLREHQVHQALAYEEMALAAA